MNYSPLVKRIAGEAADAWDLHDEAKQASLTDPDVLLLSVGDPDQGTPQPIIDAGKASLDNGRTHYSAVTGEADLRQAVAKDYQEQGFSQVSASNIAIMSGTQAGLFATVMCLLTEGDEIIVPEPMYVTYVGFLGACGVTTVPVPLEADDNFNINVDNIAAAITSKTKAILINSPHNPTGAVIAEEAMIGIGNLCKEHDLWLISDEVYSKIYFGEKPTSAFILSDILDRVVCISSLSKSHAMTGWRIGWVAGPEELIGHISNLLLGMIYGVPMFIQDAGVVALEHNNEADIMREEYRKRRALFCDAIDALPLVSCLRPAGGMFVMVNIRETGLSSTEFAKQFLKQEKVCFLAADAFGPSAKGHMRVSLTVSEDKLREACVRLERFLGTLQS